MHRVLIYNLLHINYVKRTRCDLRVVRMVSFPVHIIWMRIGCPKTNLSTPNVLYDNVGTHCSFSTVNRIFLFSECMTFHVLLNCSWITLDFMSLQHSTSIDKRLTLIVPFNPNHSSGFAFNKSFSLSSKEFIVSMSSFKQRLSGSPRHL